MKRNLWKVISALLLVCCMAFGFAACGDEEEPTPTTYSVTYALGAHAAEGAQTPTQAAVESGTSITLAQAPAAAQGWAFDGWSDSSQTYAAGASYTVTANVTFTAQWKEDATTPTPTTYSVTYALGAHAAAGAQTPTQAAVEKDYKITLASAPAAAEGYAFAGWLSGGKAYAAESEYTVTENVTFTALWATTAYSDYLGVWTDGENQSVVVSNAAADTSGDGAGNVGVAVVNGQIAAPVYAATTGFLVVTYQDTDTADVAYQLAYADNALTLVVNGEVQTFANKAEISTAANKIDGRWLREDTNQKWLVSGESAVMFLNGEQVSGGVLYIHTYALLAYENLSTTYFYLLSKSSDGLTGTFYGDPQLDPKAVTFTQGTFLTLTVGGGLNQFVDSGSAPNAALIVAPTPDTGKEFDKWVLSGTENEFDVTAAMTTDASIVAVFKDVVTAEPVTYTNAQGYTHTGTFGKTFTIYGIKVNVEKKSVQALLGSATGEYTNASFQEDCSSESGIPDSCTLFWDVKISNTAFYIGIPADGNTLYLYNTSYTKLATFTKDEGTPQPDPTSYTVTFNPNNESASWTANVASGEKVAKPTDPTSSSGKVFRYWYVEDDNNKTAYDFETAVTQDITLVALYQWKVTFSAGEGTGSVEPMYVTTWTQAGITLPDGDGLTNDSKVFAGWSDGTNTYQAESNFVGSGNHTLTAVWKDATTEPEPETTYTITFTDADGADYGKYTTTSFGFLKKDNRPADPTKDGYTFKGWSYSADGPVLENFNWTFDASKAMYAIWEAVPVADVTNAQFVGVWSDDSHEVVIISSEYNSSEYLYAVIDGKIYVFESTPGTSAERTLTDMNEVTYTFTLSDGALTVSYSATNFTISARSSATVTNANFTDYIGKTYLNGSMLLTFGYDSYSSPCVTIGSVQYIPMVIVGAYMSIAHNTTYAVTVLKLADTTVSYIDAGGETVTFTQHTHQYGELSYSTATGKVTQSCSCGDVKTYDVTGIKVDGKPASLTVSSVEVGTEVDLTGFTITATGAWGSTAVTIPADDSRLSASVTANSYKNATVEVVYTKSASAILKDTATGIVLYTQQHAGGTVDIYDANAEYGAFNANYVVLGTFTGEFELKFTLSDIVRGRQLKTNLFESWIINLLSNGTNAAVREDNWVLSNFGRTEGSFVTGQDKAVGTGLSATFNGFTNEDDGYYPELQEFTTLDFVITRTCTQGAYTTAIAITGGTKTATLTLTEPETATNSMTVCLGGEDTSYTYSAVIGIAQASEAHEHTYVNGVCSFCNALCGHENVVNEDDTCTVCGATLRKNATNYSADELTAMNVGWVNGSRNYNLYRNTTFSLTGVFASNSNIVDYSGFVTRLFVNGLPNESVFIQGNNWILNGPGYGFTSAAGHTVNEDGSIAPYTVDKTGYTWKITITWAADNSMTIKLEVWEKDADTSGAASTTGTQYLVVDDAVNSMGLWIGPDQTTLSSVKVEYTDYTYSA